MIYKSDKPYPEVRVEEKNIDYAIILMEDYAGSYSEDTAIHLYLYQSFVSSDKWCEYKDVMMHISKVEMTHLRLLGDAITKLGGVPIYGCYGADKVMRLWNSENVNYKLTLKEMLEIDIKAESKAIKRYEKHLNLIKDTYIKEIIERILEDEKIHLEIFKQLYKCYF